MREPAVYFCTLLILLLLTTIQTPRKEFQGLTVFATRGQALCYPHNGLCYRYSFFQCSDLQVCLDQLNYTISYLGVREEEFNCTVGHLTLFFMFVDEFQAAQQTTHLLTQLRYTFPRSRFRQYDLPSACILSICADNSNNLTAVSEVDYQNELTKQQTAKVTLPREILTVIPKGEAVSIAVAVFDETFLFRVREAFTNIPSVSDADLAETIVASQVISVQVAKVEDVTPLNPPIQLVLSLNQIENPNGTNVENPVCVFWDFALASK